MRLNILIGGKAGQGINKLSEIVSAVLINKGYYIFNYRDYPSLIRGGHNFNVISISDEKIGSHESQLDGIIALDEKTIDLHQHRLKKNGFIISQKGLEDLGRDLNLALAGALVKVLGIEEEILAKLVKEEFGKEEKVKAVLKGFESQKEKFELKRCKNKIKIMTGSQAVAQGAINSGINLYVVYPMTPATGVMSELAAKQIDHNLMVFQAENEIAVVNAALGASFTGSKVMLGTSGGGFDLMTEGLSLQGQTEIPLVVYLASRPGPASGIPTYTSQADLNVALRGGHGEFPRIVIAPGDPLECIEKTNEAFYLAHKFETLSIILSDKHLAESESSLDKEANKTLKIDVKNSVGKKIVRKNSYEHDEFGNTTESAEIAAKNAETRIKKYQEIKKECQKFEMIKIHGQKNSKNLIISWGSTKGAILDAIKGEDYKFLQVLYLMPLSNEIRTEIEKADQIILIEENITGQLGRLIREKTGLKIEHRILKNDGRPFTCDELKKNC